MQKGNSGHGPYRPVTPIRDSHARHWPIGAEAKQLEADMQAVVTAGVFSVVIEGVIEPVAGKLAAACRVPTIGIGASAACDGQILVTDDMLGLYDGHTPKFVRPFADLKQDIAAAAKAYRAAVIDGTFQDEREVYQKTCIDRKYQLFFTFKIVFYLSRGENETYQQLVSGSHAYRGGDIVSTDRISRHIFLQTL